MVTDYNATKFGVDIFDEMTSRHAYAPPTKRWPLKVFMHMIDTAAMNAYVLFGQNQPRREFIGKLADQLMQEQKDRRRHNKKHWINDLFIQIDDIYKSIKEKKAYKMSIKAQEMTTPRRHAIRQVIPEVSTSMSIGVCRNSLKPKMAPAPSVAFENTALAYPKPAKEAPPKTSLAPVPPKMKAAPVTPKTKPAPIPPQSKAEKTSAEKDHPTSGMCRECGKQGRTFCDNCVPPQPYYRIHMTNHICRYNAS